LKRTKLAEKVFQNEAKSPAVGARKKKKNFDVVVVDDGQNSKKRPMQKAIHEGKFVGLSENVIRYRYGKMKSSQLTLFHIETTHPELAQALNEIPKSFALATPFGLYLTERTWNGIWKNHRRGSRRTYAENFVRRYAKRGRKFSPTAIEIMRLCDTMGGFLTYDLMFQGLMAKSQLSRLGEKEALEKEKNQIVECLKKNHDPVEASDLEPVDVSTWHPSCQTQITHGWRHKNRPNTPTVAFAWALCPKCHVVRVLSEREFRPQLTT
jgi:hypothetical protein